MKIIISTPEESNEKERKNRSQHIKQKEVLMNRRSFSKHLGAVALIPAILKPTEVMRSIQNVQEEVSKQDTPDLIAGRMLSEEEKLWMAEFFKNFDKSMIDIRAMNLPHDLIPAFIPKYPPKKSKRKLDTSED